MEKIKIALIEPFNTGSHKSWALGLKKYSTHQIDLFTLPGRFWKWRMHGGAISLANKILKSKNKYDIFLVTDFIDLGLFKSIVVSVFPEAKFYIYFHENQLTYPWSVEDKDIELNRDKNYSFINYTGALIADKVFFNSDYHKKSFLKSLPSFLKQFPDKNNLKSIDAIEKKSIVLNLAVELPIFKDKIEKISKSILWNHRWEYDKNPNDFFSILKRIKDKGVVFKLIVLGEKTRKFPEIFNRAKVYFKKEIIHFGYVPSKDEYLNLLLKSEILPVTSNQEFFGVSTIEAMHSNVYPLLPNRLAFPEHIPKDKQDIHLYDTNEELEIKLTKLLTGNYKKELYTDWVRKYSWQNSIDKYDMLLVNNLD